VDCHCEKQFSVSGLEIWRAFFMDLFRIPTRKELEGIIKKTEQSLSRLKMPTRAEFDRLVKRVEALEKAVKGKKKAAKAGGGRAKKAKATTREKAPSRRRPQATDSDKVLQIIRRHSAGVDVARLKARTGFQDKKLRDIIFRLNKTGKIKRVGRGLYAAKG
jgi:predicted Rossmann fold nucleotide-binding protein DprA/Smf involved in DNA uptake